MTELAFPSEEFPAQPDVNIALTMQIPADWKPVHAKGVVMGAKRTVDDANFTPNVT